MKIQDWRIEPVVADGTEVEIVPPTGRVSIPRAWDITYALRDQPEVVHAAPMFRYLVPENAEPRVRRAAGDQAADDPATETEFDWSLRKSNVFAAWRLFGPRLPGAGIQVGHPDTGYTLHPELAGETRFHRLLATMAANHDDPGEGSGRRPHPTRRARTR